jgi:hypothetical protein
MSNVTHIIVVCIIEVIYRKKEKETAVRWKNRHTHATYEVLGIDYIFLNISISEKITGYI